MIDEKTLINYIDTVLEDKLRFQTYEELQITSKHINIQKLANQEQIRIDLAGINKIDASIHFFEAETQLHIQHPTKFRNFCDYCYLVCPEEQFDLLDSVTKKQQLSWANETGIGVISISKNGAFRVRLQSKQQNLLPIVRKEVLRVMNERYRIKFSTIPLWERTRGK